MKFLSLFSGIGGFDLAFQKAGMENVGMCEIDKPCKAILNRHFPDVIIHNDVKEISNATYQKGSIDLICGGFPCQDLSIAGKRAGLAGERSGLWFEFARIIDEIEPKWVVIENVPGLLSSNKGKDFATVIQWLAERGYGVSWRVFDAQYFGVAQRRRRVFIIGSFGNGCSAEVLFEREGLPGNTPPGRTERKEIAGTLDGKSTSSNRGSQGNETEFITATLRGFGHGCQGQHNDTNSVIAYNIQHNDGGEHRRKDRPNGGLYVNETEQSLTVGSTDLTACNAHGGPGRMDFESETFVLHDQPIIAWDRQQITNKTNRSTMRSEYAHTLNNAGQMMVGIRRLTPTECERLQGFPDGWTDWLASDSTRYRQLGNAVAVPVVEWIGKRIMESK
jgi:DNA (cytosine-5)-methyltransferase 1